MGNKNSRPVSCSLPTNCQPYVEPVAKACEDAGSSVVDKSVRAGLVSLVGATKAAELTTIWADVNGTSSRSLRNQRWEQIQPTTVAVTETGTAGAFTNFEGFKEGASNNECVEGSCAEAAAKIINNCKKVDPLIPNEIASVISNGEDLLSTNVRNAIAPPPQASQSSLYSRWINIYAPGVNSAIPTPTTTATPTTTPTTTTTTTNAQGFTNNKEGFENDNNAVYSFIRTAIIERHARFKDTASFSQDCHNNSFYSMKQFIIDEKAMLDKLHKYYTTFVSSYQSLYLHKEGVSKIINGKLDELEKIQSKIDSYKTNLHVDNRKNNYQNNNYEFYITVKYYMLIVYYSLFILFLIFSDFISDKQYTNKKILLILFIYLIIPIILSYLVNITYEGYIYFLEYNNIKEDTLSYADIIKRK